MSNIARIGLSIGEEKEKWSLLYNEKEHSEAEIKEWIDACKKSSFSHDDLLMNLMNVKGVLCIPTENADKLKEWVNDFVQESRDNVEVVSRDVELEK